MIGAGGATRQPPEGLKQSDGQNHLGQFFKDFVLQEDAGCRHQAEGGRLPVKVLQEPKDAEAVVGSGKLIGRRSGGIASHA